MQRRTTHLRSRIVRAAVLTLAALGLALTTGGGTAVAATYPTSTLTVKSTDDHARGTAWVTWMSATHVKVEIENCDISADGRGAILWLIAFETDGTEHLLAYDHQLKGNGACTYAWFEPKDPQVDVRFLRLRECNGGSQSSPQRCDFVQKGNPLDGA